jgi:hypothetical protein
MSEINKTGARQTDSQNKQGNVATEKSQANQEEQARSEKLKESRRGRFKKISPKKAIKSTLRLFDCVEVEDYIFVGMAIAVALLKDISDYVGLGSIPLIGTALTLMATIFIAAAMYLAGAKGQKKNKMFFKRALAYIGGTGAEFIFGLDFLPIETAMVGYLYYLLLKERSSKNED